MARTNGSTAEIDFTVRDTVETMAPCTVAVLARPASLAAGVGWFTARTSGGTLVFGLQVNATDDLQLYDTVGANPTGTVTTRAIEAEWQILGCSVGAGGTTPRFHRLRWSTGGWAHQDADATLAAHVAPGSGGVLIIGGGETATAQGQHGGLGYWRRSMTDGEFEQLAGGHWSTFDPDSLWLGNADDHTMTVARDHGRLRHLQATISGTHTRYVGVDPSGYLYDVLTRRR